MIRVTQSNYIINEIFPDTIGEHEYSDVAETTSDEVVLPFSNERRYFVKEKIFHLSRIRSEKRDTFPNFTEDPVE